MAFINFRMYPFIRNQEIIGLKLRSPIYPLIRKSLWSSTGLASTSSKSIKFKIMRKSIKTTVFQTIAVFIIMCLVTACSKKNENNEEENNTSGKHTYHIEIAGGKTYSGSLPSYAPGVGTQFNPVAFI